MNAIEKMDMLVKYERIDKPQIRKEQVGWSMYLAEKIVNFCGARELSMLLGYDPEQPEITIRRVVSELMKP